MIKMENKLKLIDKKKMGGKDVHIRFWPLL